jgi:hypothetical protein
MRNRQLGLSLTALIFGAILAILAALLGMKLAPPYMQYFTAKKLITQVANEGSTSVMDMRRSFELKSAIDDVGSLKPSDLEITKEGGEVVISFAYRKEIPLFANIGLYLEFAASSKGEAAP